MRFQLGIVACLLAGCATQPTSAGSQIASGDTGTSGTGASDAASSSGASSSGTSSGASSGRDCTGARANHALLHELAAGNAMRLGVEFLPPADDENGVAVPPTATNAQGVTSTEPTRQRPTAPRAARARETRGGERHTWTLSNDDLAAMRTPIERETLNFLDDVREEDRRRLRRELGTPVLTLQTVDLQSPSITLPDDDPLAEERAEWLADNGLALLRRPAHHLLRRLPMVRGVEIELDDFKSDNFPLSQAYRRSHQEERNLGRVSMRVHTGNLKDPVEIVYMKSGVRVGTSQEVLKLGFARRLSDDLTLELRSRYDYDQGNWRVRADLGWVVSPTTSLHFVAGDDLDFLTTSTFYSLFESPMDGSPGVLFYAVHLF